MGRFEIRARSAKPDFSSPLGFLRMESGPLLDIQFCSDLHLELPLETTRFGEHLLECLATAELPREQSICDAILAGNVLPTARSSNSTYLALLGDVFDAAKIRNGAYHDFLLKQCHGFKAVFVVAGNHEFYGGEYNSIRVALADLCRSVTKALNGTPVVHFMDCVGVDLPDSDIRLLGCTLWSHVPDFSSDDVAMCLNDYRVISVSSDLVPRRKATVDDTNAWHKREVEWLMGELQQAESSGRRCVVLTHHAPSFHSTCAPEHKESLISSAFCTNLEPLLKPPVTAWLFGHTHWSSWQRYQADPQNPPRGAWCTLEGIGSLPFACDAGKAEVLVASNQVGYGATGEHWKTRCIPGLSLLVSRDGGYAALQSAWHRGHERG